MTATIDHESHREIKLLYWIDAETGLFLRKAELHAELASVDRRLDLARRQIEILEGER